MDFSAKGEIGSPFYEMLKALHKELYRMLNVVML
jgi:hypothetical protein